MNNNESESTAIRKKYVLDLKTKPDDYLISAIPSHIRLAFPFSHSNFSFLLKAWGGLKRRNQSETFFNSWNGKTLFTHTAIDGDLAAELK